MEITDAQSDVVDAFDNLKMEKSTDALEGGDTPHAEGANVAIDELKTANAEMSKALEVQARTIAQQAQMITQLQTALGETTGHVLTLAKAMGKIMA